jgi:hypothetical protein
MTFLWRSGGVVTAVFKSARNFFDIQRPDFSRNQFGASAGGPKCQ